MLFDNAYVLFGDFAPLDASQLSLIILFQLDQGWQVYIGCASSPVLECLYDALEYALAYFESFSPLARFISLPYNVDFSPEDASDVLWVDHDGHAAIVTSANDRYTILGVDFETRSQAIQYAVSIFSPKPLYFLSREVSQSHPTLLTLLEPV